MIPSICYSLFTIHYSLFTSEALYPFASIHEGLNPWGNLVLTAVSGIPSALPGEDGTLQVGHHAEMTTIGRADAGNIVGGTVRISGIAVIVVLGNDIVSALSFGQ